MIDAQALSDKGWDLCYTGCAAVSSIVSSEGCGLVVAAAASVLLVNDCSASQYEEPVLMPHDL